MTSILFLTEASFSDVFISETKNMFSIFFSDFLNLDLILNIFLKKMTFIADGFLNLRTPKSVVSSMSKMSRFRGPLAK